MDSPTVVRLGKLAARYAMAQGNTRVALGRSLRGAIAAAIAERHELDAWLERKWGWFTRHPDHPRFVQREDEWIAVLRAYEAISDAIVAATAAKEGNR